MQPLSRAALRRIRADSWCLCSKYMEHSSKFSSNHFYDFPAAPLLFRCFSDSLEIGEQKAQYCRGEHRPHGQMLPCQKVFSSVDRNCWVVRHTVPHGVKRCRSPAPKEAAPPGKTATGQRRTRAIHSKKTVMATEPEGCYDAPHPLPGNQIESVPGRRLKVQIRIRLPGYYILSPKPTQAKKATAAGASDTPRAAPQRSGSRWPARPSRPQRNGRWSQVSTLLSGLRPEETSPTTTSGMAVGQGHSGYSQPSSFPW